MESTDTGTSGAEVSTGAGDDGFEGESPDFFTNDTAKPKYRVYEPGKGEKKPPVQAKQKAPAAYEQPPKEPQSDDDEEKSQEEKIKLVVEGEEKEYTIDELKKVKSLEQSSYKKMERAAELTRKAEETIARFEKIEKMLPQYENSHRLMNNFVTEINKDPSVIFRIAESMGHDVDKLAEDRLYNKWQYSNLSEEQRDYLRLKEFEKHALAKHEDEKVQAAKAKYESSKQTYAAGLNTQFSELFKELGGRPDPLTLKLTIEQIQMAEKQKRPITVKEAHTKVVQALQPQYREKWLKEMSESDIKSLPKEFLDNIRKRDVERFKQEAVPGRKANAPSLSDESQQSSRQPKPISAEKFFDDMEARHRRR
jgi:hypothetical protein